MNILYISTYGLKYYTMILIKEKLDIISNQEFWDKIEYLNSTDTEGQVMIYETFYWLNSGKFDIN